MDRRKLLLGFLAAPLAALAAARDGGLVPAGRKYLVGETPGETILPVGLPTGPPVRVLYVPKGLSQKQRHIIMTQLNDALHSGKLMVLEEGFEYREYYGGPGEIAVCDEGKGYYPDGANVRYAYSYEVNANGEPINFTAHPVERDGTITFNPPHSGKEVRFIVDPDGTWKRNKAADAYIFQRDEIARFFDVPLRLIEVY